MTLLPHQGGCESGLCPQPHHRCDSRQPTPPVTFLHLAVDQARRHLPLTHVPASTTLLEPVPKMGRQGIKGQVQAIAGEERNAARMFRRE